MQIQILVKVWCPPPNKNFSYVAKIEHHSRSWSRKFVRVLERRLPNASLMYDINAFDTTDEHKTLLRTEDDWNSIYDRYNQSSSPSDIPKLEFRVLTWERGSPFNFQKIEILIPDNQETYECHLYDLQYMSTHDDCYQKLCTNIELALQQYYESKPRYVITVPDYDDFVIDSQETIPTFLGWVIHQPAISYRLVIQIKDDDPSENEDSDTGSDIFRTVTPAAKKKKSEVAPADNNDVITAGKGDTTLPVPLSTTNVVMDRALSKEQDDDIAVADAKKDITTQISAVASLPTSSEIVDENVNNVDHPNDDNKNKKRKSRKSRWGPLPKNKDNDPVVAVTSLPKSRWGKKINVAIDKENEVLSQREIDNKNNQLAMAGRATALDKLQNQENNPYRRGDVSNHVKSAMGIATVPANPDPEPNHNTDSHDSQEDYQEETVASNLKKNIIINLKGNKPDIASRHYTRYCSMMNESAKKEILVCARSMIDEHMISIYFPRILQDITEHQGQTHETGDVVATTTTNLKQADEADDREGDNSHRDGQESVHDDRQDDQSNHHTMAVRPRSDTHQDSEDPDGDNSHQDHRESVHQNHGHMEWMNTVDVGGDSTLEPHPYFTGMTVQVEQQNSNDDVFNDAFWLNNKRKKKHISYPYPNMITDRDGLKEKYLRFLDCFSEVTTNGLVSMVPNHSKLSKLPVDFYNYTGDSNVPIDYLKEPDEIDQVVRHDFPMILNYQFELICPKCDKQGNKTRITIPNCIKDSNQCHISSGLMRDDGLAHGLRLQCHICQFDMAFCSHQNCQSLSGFSNFKKDHRHQECTKPLLTMKACPKKKDTEHTSFTGQIAIPDQSSSEQTFRCSMETCRDPINYCANCHLLYKKRHSCDQKHENRTSDEVLDQKIKLVKKCTYGNEKRIRLYLKRNGFPDLDIRTFQTWRDNHYEKLHTTNDVRLFYEQYSHIIPKIITETGKEIYPVIRPRTIEKFDQETKTYPDLSLVIPCYGEYAKAAATYNKSAYLPLICLVQFCIVWMGFPLTNLTQNIFGPIIIFIAHAFFLDDCQPIEKSVFKLKLGRFAESYLNYHETCDCHYYQPTGRATKVEKQNNDKESRMSLGKDMFYLVTKAVEFLTNRKMPKLAWAKIGSNGRYIIAHGGDSCSDCSEELTVNTTYIAIIAKILKQESFTTFATNVVNGKVDRYFCLHLCQESQKTWHHTCVVHIHPGCHDLNQYDIRTHDLLNCTETVTEYYNCQLRIEIERVTKHGGFYGVL